MTAGNVVCLFDASGQLFRCGLGARWITEDGSGGDTTLTADQRERICQNGKALIRAVKRSLLTIGS